MLVVVSSGCGVFRFDARASQTMNMSMITAVSEINEPMEDKVFHEV